MDDWSYIIISPSERALFEQPGNHQITSGGFFWAIGKRVFGKGHSVKPASLTGIVDSLACISHRWARLSRRALNLQAIV